MNRVAILALIFILPFGVDGGDLRNTYYWYCPRCNYRASSYQSMDEIIENRPPAKPSYNERNCPEAHGKTYCYWALHKGTADVDLDRVTEYREKKEKMRKIKEENQKEPEIAFEESPTRKFNNLMWEYKKADTEKSVSDFLKTRAAEADKTKQETDNIKNFNTDLVAPAAPFEVLKK